jgi:hypothetical protein
MELPRGFDYGRQGFLTMQPLEKSLDRENSNYSYSGGGK